MLLLELCHFSRFWVLAAGEIVNDIIFFCNDVI
jgi:hypothetical protein